MMSWRCCLGLAVAATVASGAASATDWTVVGLSGSARVRTSAAPSVPVVLGMQVPPNASLQTSARGSVTLQRGETIVSVSPGTLIQTYDQGPDTTLLEHRGKVDLEVETRGVPYFNVSTPTLAAVVKGTRFSVSTGQRGSSVVVERGLVGVTELKSGKTADVAAGQSASASRDANRSFSVSGIGSLPAITQGLPQQPQVATTPTTAPALATAASSGSASKSGADQSEGRGGKGEDSGHGAGKGEGNGSGSGKGEGNGKGDGNDKGDAGRDGNGKSDAGGRGGGNAGGNGGGNAGGNGGGNAGGNGGGSKRD